MVFLCVVYVLVRHVDIGADEDVCRPHELVVFSCVVSVLVRHVAWLSLRGRRRRPRQSRTAGVNDE